MQQQRQTSSSVVEEAIKALDERGQVVTRDTIQTLSGLKKTVIDDRLKVLERDGKIVRIERGVYRHVDQCPPPRPMSKTLLPDRRVKLEIGDQVLELTPEEDRMLARLQGGAAVEAAHLESGRAVGTLAAQIARCVMLLERTAVDLRLARVTTADIQDDMPAAEQFDKCDSKNS